MKETTFQVKLTKQGAQNPSVNTGCLQNTDLDKVLYISKHTEKNKQLDDYIMEITYHIIYVYELKYFLTNLK